jgi:hypothetical protein
MPLLKRLICSSVFVLFLAGTGVAQEQRAAGETPAGPVTVSGPLVTVTATPQRVRFVSPGTVVQLRLEVYNEAGQKLFDTELRGGNVLDWHLQDGAGQRLTAGSYACVLTVKSLSGRLSQRVGRVTVNDKAVAVGATQLSTAQQQTIGPVEENAAFMVRQESEAITAVTHDGVDGQLTSTAGALTFRTGDVFAGLDKEHMRITPEGNVGIGTDKPLSRLDVAGTIRTNTLRTAGGVEFADGSRLTSKDGKLVTTNASGEPQTPDVSGTGTTGRITKWTDGPTGTLGDSILGESGNGVEVRSPTGGAGTNPTFINPNNIAGYALLQSYPASGINTNQSLQVVPRGTGAVNNRSQISVFNTDFIADPINYEFSSLRARGSDFVFGTGKTGTGLNRPLMFATGFLGDNITNNNQFYLATNGNVGVGTGSPTQKLDVVGNIKASGSLAVATANVVNQLIVDTSTLVVNAANNRVGIGTLTPAVPLDVVGDINTSTQYNIAGSRVLSNAGVGNLFAGVGAGAVNTGSGNSFFGSGAGDSNTSGYENTFVGRNAGAANTTSQGNSFFGADAGLVNNGGQNNSFFGLEAGDSNTSGSFNAFFGAAAGAANTTASGNSFFGYAAGQTNIIGTQNSFFGERAGALNKASANSFFGTTAGNANTTGASNSFFGANAGLANSLGSSNSFFGTNAGAANTTSDNSFFGKDAGLVNTSGDGNSFFGKSAGAANTIAEDNSFFGESAGTANTTGSDNSFFGAGAGDSNIDGKYNSLFGDGAGNNNTSGDSNTFVGRFTGLSNTTEDNNTFLGANSNGAAAITNATAIGANAVVTQSDSLILGNAVKVGAGTAAPKEKLHVLGGNIYIDGVAASDNGIILKSPDGTTCAKLTISNAGALVTTIVPCP